MHFQCFHPSTEQRGVPQSGQHFPTSSFEEKNYFCHQLSQHHCFMGNRLPDTFDTVSDVKCLLLASLILIGNLCFELCHISAQSVLYE